MGGGLLVALRRWMKDRGWPVVAEHTDLVTCDPKRRRRDPPGLVKAIRLIDDRKANVLVIFAADRLVADPIPLINLVARVQDMGGDVCSYEDGRELVDTTCEESLFTIFIRGMFNWWRLKLNRRASIAGQQRARLEGRLPGRPKIPLLREQVEEARAALQAAGTSENALAPQRRRKETPMARRRTQMHRLQELVRLHFRGSLCLRVAQGIHM